MLDLAPGVEALIEARVKFLTACWAVTRNDAVVVRGTMHDRDVTIDSGPYAGTYHARNALRISDSESASDGSVQNVDAEGGFFYWGSIPEFTIEDIEAGLYDQAKAELLLVHWPAPATVIKVITAGTLGEFERDSDGLFRTEVRGPTQALSQQIMSTYSERCDVKRFGDLRCGFNVAGVTRTGTVDTVTDRRRFAATLDAGPAPADDAYYGGGNVTFTSGDNAGFEREVRAHTPVDGLEAIEILLHDEEPADVSPGDTFSLEPGCDRLWSTCRHTYDNIVNFRGFGILAPGKDKLLRDPKTVIGQQVVTFPTLADHQAQRAATAARFLEIMGLA